jgi:hypothetical protein
MNLHKGEEALFKSDVFESTFSSSFFPFFFLSFPFVFLCFSFSFRPLSPSLFPFLP